AGGGVEDGGKDQGVQGTPGVEPPAGDLELVRGGSLGQAAADDTAVLVVFGVGHGRQRLPNIIDPAAGGGGELVDSDGLAGGQQGEQRLPQPGLAAGASPPLNAVARRVVSCSAAESASGVLPDRTAGEGSVRAAGELGDVAGEGLRGELQRLERGQGRRSGVGQL